MAIAIRTLAERAMRLIGELDAEDDISDIDGATALEAFQGLFADFVSDGILGPVTDTLQTDLAYTAEENERVIGATSVTLPTTVTDAYTGLTRAPKDRSVIIIAGDTPGTHVYDADLAAWIPIHDLDLDDDAPLSGRFRQGLTALLAVQLAAEFGSNVPPQVADNAVKGRYAIGRKFPKRAAPVESALLRANPNQGLSSTEASVDVTTIGAEIPDMSAIFYSALNA